MKIQTAEHGSVTVVRPEDRLDILGYLELEECFQGLLARGRTRIVLDLEETTFINSTAMAVMGRFWADCAKAGGALVIARPSREARNFLRLGDVDDLIAIHPDVDAAVGAAGADGFAGPDADSPGAGSR
jgi:anti-sigma B factor antagonist